MRRPNDLSPEDVPDFPAIRTKTDSQFQRQASLDHTPQSPSPLFTLNEPKSPVTLTKVVSPVLNTSQTTSQSTEASQHPSQSSNQAQTSTPSSQSTRQRKHSVTDKSGQNQEKKFPSRRASREKKQVPRMDSRSRLPSISHLQEKLRKRWPRTLRIAGISGGNSGSGGDSQKDKASKYWKTAPRLVRHTFTQCARMIISKNHNSLDCEQSLGFDIKQSPIVQDMYGTNLSILLGQIE